MAIFSKEIAPSQGNVVSKKSGCEFLFTVRVVPDDSSEDAVDFRLTVEAVTAALQYFAALKTAGITPLLMAPSGVAMACIPILVPYTSPFDAVVNLWPISDSATKYQKMLNMLTVTQGSLAILQLLLGDLLGGVIGCLLSGIGHHACTPSGVAWVPTYSVLTFMNGSVGMLGLMEKMAYSKFALFSFHNPVVVNAVHAMVLFNPLLSFAGLYYSYGYLRELRCMNPNGSMMETPEPNMGETETSPTPASRPTNYVPFSGNAHMLTQ